MHLNLTREPFSRFGSYLSLGHESGAPWKMACGAGYYLRSHHALGLAEPELFFLEILLHRAPVPATASATAAEWRFTRQEGMVSIGFDPAGSLRVRGCGLGLRLRAASRAGLCAYHDGPRAVTVNPRRSLRRYGIELLVGDLLLDASGGGASGQGIQVDCLPGADGVMEAALDEYWSTWVRPASRPAHAEVLAGAEAAFADFASAFGAPPAAPDLADAWRRAIYVLWASTVAPCGLLRRPAVLMSKQWMAQVWSWDHCFNAQALAGAHPALAWDQWQVMFDHQDSFGAIPDGLNDMVKHYNYCKPPVHGWTARELLRAGVPRPDRTRLQEIFHHLAAHTRWFLDHRRRPGDALPYYLHGNDSGWDNATMFDEGVPLIAPDLAALLVLQSEVLAELAKELGDSAAGTAWSAQSREILAGLLALWDGRAFVPRRIAGDRRIEVRCRSLIPSVPIILGLRLGRDIADSLSAGIRDFVTAHGVATEHPESPRYEDDGYWRGPSWAPSTYLMTRGLADAGQTALAENIARTFCRTCAREGFAENFDSRSGAGLRDRSYTWTASVFLLLAREGSVHNNPGTSQARGLCGNMLPTAVLPTDPAPR